MSVETVLARIYAAYQFDHENPRIAVERDDLPLSFEAITDTWLTNVLCHQVPGAKVIGHRLGAPDNGTTNRRKLYVDYNVQGEVAGLVRAFFAKATHDLQNRVALGITDAARREVLFYSLVREHLSIEAPRCYYAHIDLRSFNSMILLEDLSEQVTSFCSHDTPIGVERARSQMRLLATLHGAGYSQAALRKQLLSLPSFADLFASTQSLGFNMQEGASNGFLAAQAVIPPRLFSRFAEVWPATVRSVAFHEQVEHTFIHCDVHLKNWYVAGNGEMGLGDWQCSGRGHWGRDLAYTLATSLLPEDRRQWERELVALYLDQLHALGGPQVAFADGWNVYRQQLLSALAWWTVTLCPPPGLPDMQPRDTTLEFIRRIATAIDDLDALDALN